MARHQHIEGQPSLKRILVHGLCGTGVQEGAGAGNPGQQIARQQISPCLGDGRRRGAGILQPAYRGGDEINPGNVITAVSLAVIQHNQTAVGPTHQYGPLQFGFFDHGSDIVGPILAILVSHRIVRFIRLPMAPIVDGDHAEFFGQITLQLRLPGQMALHEAVDEQDGGPRRATPFASP